ncbi:response regulator transcription factor [Amphibacillus xylanus]|uniref:response regulator transcription factor n=1 Tax=Amphibacillus xylanus TaxID=1449 RepID=UPI0022B221FA|nr:LuxR C-terminal-related transcriptional regulator [Amphibacillus xylanus]
MTIPIDLFTQLRLSEYEVELENGQKVILTEKEQEILVEVSKGLTNEETAENVYMSKRTLERNLTNIYKKLQVASREEALVKAFELGLIPDVII